MARVEECCLCGKPLSLHSVVMSGTTVSEAVSAPKVNDGLRFLIWPILAIIGLGLLIAPVVLAAYVVGFWSDIKSLILEFRGLIIFALVAFTAILIAQAIAYVRKRMRKSNAKDAA